MYMFTEPWGVILKTLPYTDAKGNVGGNAVFVRRKNNESCLS